ARPPLFPYTTLFRSRPDRPGEGADDAGGLRVHVGAVHPPRRLARGRGRPRGPTHPGARLPHDPGEDTMSADISIPPAAESPAPGTGSPGESEPASASPRRRRFRPRRAIIAGIALVLLLFAGWTGITYWQLVSASNSFDEGDFAASEAAGHRFLEMSPFEAHKGHFAIGTARAADGDLDTAHSELETALSTAPPADECAVRINLALVQETQGNDFRDSEDTDAANERYDAATATLTNAPEECRPSGSGTDERMSQQEERVGESQEQMNNPQEPGEGEDGGDEGEGGDSGED